MAKVRLNLSRLPIPQKIAKARQIVDALTGNSSFPTPTPALAAVTAGINALDTAYKLAQSARQTAKERTSDQNQKEDALNLLMTQLAAYVESAAGNSEQLVLSVGMDVRDASIATGEHPTQPQALTPTEGDHDGEVDLTWDKVPGSKSYAIEKSVDPATAATWTHAGVSTRSNFTVNGLTSGGRYWFRVAAVNSNGQSGWSDPATKIAP